MQDVSHQDVIHLLRLSFSGFPFLNGFPALYLFTAAGPDMKSDVFFLFPLLLPETRSSKTLLVSVVACAHVDHLPLTA